MDYGLSALSPELNHVDQKILRTFSTSPDVSICSQSDLIPLGVKTRTRAEKKKKICNDCVISFCILNTWFIFYFFQTVSSHLCKLQTLLSALVSAFFWQSCQRSHCFTLRSAKNTKRMFLVLNLQLSVNSSHTVTCTSSCSTSSLAGRCATALDSRHRFEPYCAADCGVSKRRFWCNELITSF